METDIINPVVNYDLKRLLTLIRRYQKNINYICTEDITCYHLNEQTINIILANNHKHIEIIFKSNRSYLFNCVLNKLKYCEQNGQLSYFEIIKKENENWPCMKFSFL